VGLLVEESLTQGGFFGRLNNILFGRPQANRPGSRPQLANQLAADGATGLSANQVGVVDGIRDVADAADIDGAVDVEDGFRQFGSTGECRHNFHCQGAERCVKKNGMFICTKRFCNVDKDCRDGQTCRDQKCRRCSRCKDDLSAPNPK